MAEFTVCSLVSAPITDGHVNAYFKSSDYATIFGAKMKASQKITRYICISNGSKKVYKLYRGMNIVPEGMIALDYESQCVLETKEGDNVCVKPISKLKYEWHSSSLLARISLCIGVGSVILTLMSHFFN